MLAPAPSHRPSGTDFAEQPVFLDQGAFTVGWLTDESIGRPSTPRFDEARVACLATSSPLTHFSLTPNERVEGVLVAAGDTHWWKVDLAASMGLTITADLVAAGNSTTHLDIYGSTSSSNPFPSDTSYSFSGVRPRQDASTGGGGEFATLASSTSPRTVYFAVTAKNGPGHYILHASQSKATSKTAMDVCYHGANPQSSPNWSNYKATMRRVAARVSQMSGGGLWLRTWTHRLVDCSQSPVWCDGATAATGKGCDVVITPAISGDPLITCGFQGQISGRFRVPNVWSCGNYADTAELSRKLAHEAGHGLLGLADEYEVIGAWAANDQGPFCGHSIMNGPRNSHMLCDSRTHCYDPAWSSASARYYTSEPGECHPSLSGWSKLAASGLVPATAIPNTAYSPDPWDSLRVNSTFTSNFISFTPP